MIISVRGFFLFAVAFPTLVGCTAASMRVEVDVYKGPLSREPQVQLGELKGLLNSMAEHFKGLGEKAHQVYDDYWCFDAMAAEAQLFCTTLATIKKGCEYAVKLNNEAAFLDTDKCAQMDCSDRRQDVVKSLVEISTISATLKSRAINDAYFQNAWRPVDQTTRILATSYINLASEASNQLGSRADALLKQLNGTRAENLAQSVYLRDSAPTSLLNAFVWDRAMAPYLDGEFDTFNHKDHQDRIRALEQHFADHYWSNINTVVASGEGDVGMALVKDDIGNWNLKNFENDPTELIQAYKNVGLATLKTAASLAEKSATGPLTNAQSFLTAANQFNFGSPPTAYVSQESLLTHLSTSTSAGLRGLANQARVRSGELQQTIAKASTSKMSMPVNAEPACVNDRVGEEALRVKKTALDVLVELSPVSSAQAQSAKDAARCALNNLEKRTVQPACKFDPKDSACLSLAKSKAWINHAGQWREIHLAQTELAALPGRVAKDIRKVLDGYERILQELARAGEAGK